MENFNNLATETGMKTLREGIKNKYKQYQALDRDRFPDFEFNTNRANYEPLRQSFEDEFYVVRRIDRNQSNIHIPSTNTLALIFCEEGYVPGKKILNTCQSYAEGKAKRDIDPATPVATQPPSKTPAKTRRILLASTAFMIGLLIATVSYRQSATASASGLVINKPAFGRIVPMEVLAEGKVLNAGTVWIVVRYIKGMRYWVQPPIKVDDDGTWKGPIYIGSYDKGDIGLRSQVRAFVNPVKPLTEGDILNAWPEAELSSEIVEVVRGNETTGVPN